MKSKVFCSRHNVLKSKIASVKFPCGVCMKGVGANSILCLSSRNWVHKRCFNELLPILTKKIISLVNHEKVFKVCVRYVLLYGSENWPLSAEDLSRIKRCDHAMIRWLSNVKIEQKHSTEDLRRRSHIHHIEDVLRCNRLRLSGHFHRQIETSCTKKIMSFNVDGPTSRGRPKLRWKDVVNADLRKKHLNISLACDRSKWRNAIRPVTQ